MITTSLELSLLVLTLEFALISATIAFFSYRALRKTEVKITADATKLVNKVVDTEESRRTALETVFKVKYQYDGDELATMVDEFMQREKAFYNAVVGAFMGRDKTKLSDLSDELTKVVAPWISMSPKNIVDPKEVESLVTTNTHLETELAETKKVLEGMIAEYNRAFHIDESVQDMADSPQDELAKEDEEIETEETVSINPEDAIDEATDTVETELETEPETKSEAEVEPEEAATEEAVPATPKDASDEVIDAAETEAESEKVAIEESNDKSK